MSLAPHRSFCPHMRAKHMRSPQAFFAWRDTPDTPDKCRLLFGVAAVTHMYEAHDVTVWALELALNMLELHTRPFVPEPELLSDLYTFTQKIWMDVGNLPGRPNNVLHWQRVEAIWMMSSQSRPQTPYHTFLRLRRFTTRPSRQFATFTLCALAPQPSQQTRDSQPRTVAAC